MAKMVELRAVQPSFPLYGTLTLQQGRYSHALLRDHGVLVRPELLTQLGICRSATRCRSGRRRSDSRRHRSRAGPNVGAFSLGLAHPDRLRRSRLDRVARLRQPRASRQLQLQIGGTADQATHVLAEALSTRFRQRVRARAQLSPARERPRRGPGARRELSESRRTGRADSRRHRRVERDARLRPAEGPEHRHPEVRRRLVADGARAST